MKIIKIICFLLVLPLWVLAQQDTSHVQGTASYVSSQNVYVKFQTTAKIDKGDTLFVTRNHGLIPALIVKDKSSTSCICGVLLPEKIKVGDAFLAIVAFDKKSETDKADQKSDEITAIDSTITPSPVVVTPQEDQMDSKLLQKWRGRISAASYSNQYGEETTHRMRYSLTFNGQHIRNSRFSTDNYLTFRHTIGEWNAVQENLADALKVYSLSVSYQLDEHSIASFGRKINYRISSMGAIDGLQVEKGWGAFQLGAIAGSRPDFADYGLNLQLFQAGGYLGHTYRKDDKSTETTLAFVEQRNLSFTDRRFIYFQHSNTWWKDFSFFGSTELDLYQRINDTITNRPSLTNMLINLRYRLSKKISLNVAYDNRKNIIYYESYRSYIDQLIDDETRQGLRAGMNYRISKRFTCGLNASWRFQKSDANLSRNLNAYVNISRIPVIGASASLSANWLQTHYLDSKIYGLRVNKEIIKGKLNSELYFRMVDYQYKSYEFAVRQQIAGADLTWNITPKLSFYVYYEGTFDRENSDLTRINMKIIQRL